MTWGPASGQLSKKRGLVRSLVHALPMYEVSKLSTRPRVTVVNHAPEFLEVIGDVLAERYEPTLIDASDPNVLEAIGRSQPSLLLLTIGPPGEGLAPGNARTIPHQPELGSVPVLLCTTVRNPDSAEGMSSPPLGVIQMPFAPEDLTAEIDRLLRAAPPLGRPAFQDLPTQPFATGS